MHTWWCGGLHCCLTPLEVSGLTVCMWCLHVFLISSRGFPWVPCFPPPPKKKSKVIWSYQIVRRYKLCTKSVGLVWTLIGIKSTMNAPTPLHIHDTPTTLVGTGPFPYQQPCPRPLQTWIGQAGLRSWWIDSYLLWLCWGQTLCLWENHMLIFPAMPLHAFPPSHWLP